MTTEYEKELKNVVYKGWQKAVQIIVQSRLGVRLTGNENIPTDNPANVSFFLKIEENLEINNEFKKCFGNKSVSVEIPFSIEILLRTKDKQMILEVWSLSIEDVIDPATSIPPLSSITIYSRMSILIKSIMAATRLTPAYNLSFRQGPDNFIICYKMYTGQAQIDCLGEDIKQEDIGDLNLHLFRVKMQLAYRTKLTFDSQMMLKSDHFKVENSPKHGRRYGERGSESDSIHELGLNDDSETSLGLRPLIDSPLGFRMESIHSRTNSESSPAGSQSNTSEKIYIPFANQRDTTIDDFIPDLPTANLLIEATDVEKAKEFKQEIIALKERRISESKMPKLRPEKISSSVVSGRSLPKEDEFLHLDVKSLFSLDAMPAKELSDFFNGVERAETLKSFETEDDSIGLTGDLHQFELQEAEFDDLIKSVNIDTQSSESLDFT